MLIRLLKKINRIDEIEDFKQKIKHICVKNNLSFFLTKRAKDYFDLHLRDYYKLAEMGVDIKSKRYLLSNDFENYKNDINSILKRPLKNIQIQAAIHIIEMEKSLNFSVPGSGKTATVLGAFEYLANRSKLSDNYVDKILVIGPTNCAKSWQDEYQEVSFASNDKLPLCLINDDSIHLKEDVLLHDFQTSRIILINYELIPRISDTLKKLIDSHTIVVFDEIHRIKRIDSQKYEKLKEIVFNTRYRIALTGTPLPNGYIDLYNMISLLHDDYTFLYFKAFESSLKNNDKNYKKTGIQNVNFNNLLSPFFIRINKKDLNVPLPQPDHLIEIKAYKNECEIYNKIVDSKYNAFESNIKLVKVGCIPHSCETIIDIPSTNKLPDSSDVFLTSKLCKFLSILKANNRKSVVWCNFIETINVVHRLLLDNKYYAKTIYGDTSLTDREKIIDEFNYGPLQVLVTNPATLAESVSLHKSCHDAHYLELNYNLYQFLQSKDRIHRLGIKDNEKTNYYIYLNYYDDKMTKSEDLEIYKALKRKEELMKKSIEKGNFVFGEVDNMEF